MPFNNEHIIIIAEAGVNHNGDLGMAKQMIKAAKDAGADYVKFQTAVPELLIAANAPKAEYQKRTTGSDESQLDMVRKIMLPLDEYAALADECAKEGIGFMSTPFDLVSIDVLASISMDYWKVPSGEITNLPYLRKIAQRGERVILSTGMSTMQEVDEAVHVLTSNGTSIDNIALLHCTTQYPTPFSAVNLRAMLTLNRPGIGAIGYSDHTEGITIPIAAASMGARIIEKHFTLDRNLPGPDHKASLTPEELKAMVTAIRQVEVALGDGSKRVTEAERPNINIARKSIVAATPIAAGEIFTTENLTTKRPGGGLSPMIWDKVIGRTAKRNYLPDQQIEL